MDISTPSPTSSPDIRLDSPDDFQEVETFESSPPQPPIPGVDVDDEVDIGVSVRSNVVAETDNASVPPLNNVPSLELGKKTPPEIRLATSPDQEQQKSGGAILVKQTEQMKIGDENVLVLKISSDRKDVSSVKDEEEDDLVIAEEISLPEAKSSKRKQDSDADSDAMSDISDVTVSSVHTSDLSSFDEEISSSSDSSDSESSESSISDKESKKCKYWLSWSIRGFSGTALQVLCHVFSHTTDHDAGVHFIKKKPNFFASF